MRRSSWSLVVAFLFAVLTLAPVLPAAAEQRHITHGIDPANMDRTVDPGVDFYRYANGGWLDRATIPADFASLETMSELDGRTRLQLVNLLTERAESGDVQVSSDEWKAIQFFEQGVDLATRNEQGIAPIQPILDKIDALDDLTSLHRFLESSIFQSIPGLFFVSAGPDLIDSSRTVAYLNGPSLGLPARDYYLAEDPHTQPVRDAYIATGAELLALTEIDGTQGREDMKAVFAFEAALAGLTLSPEEVEDLSQIYNPTSPADLSASYPLMDWAGYLDALGIADQTKLIVVETRYLHGLEKIVRETPLSVIKNHLKLQLLWSASSNLSEVIEATAFGYYGTALSGLEVLAPIEGRTLDQVNYHLGDAVAKLYLNAYFPPEAKARSEALVDQIVAAFRSRLERNAWMTDETRTNVLAKIDTLQVKIGYPDRFRDYGDVEIAESYFGSALSAFNAWYRDKLTDIGNPVDRSEWPFPPQTVNAFYNPLNNEIIIPAAMLQPPFFDYQADAASNFGAIGFVIGHEITHGFDPQGSQFDGDGNLSDWWTDEDRAQFEALNDRVVNQYARIEVIDGLFVDGELTVTENVADLGGIQVAFDALQLELERHAEPISSVDASELTTEQRFFIAASTIWRAKTRDEALHTQLIADPHAPASVRGTQPLRNCDAFFAVFDIGPGDPMYLSPSERVVIW